MGPSIYVLYHANCYDGFGAAYAAWKTLGDRACYIPVTYGAPPPEMTGASEIYIVDFSYKKDVLIELCRKHLSAKVVVLDHHKTAQEDLHELAVVAELPNLKVTFDMKKSGALLTWEYFHPGTSIPKLIAHISDRDLWTYKIAGSREVHAALVSYPFDFKVWDNLNVDALILEGPAIVRYQSSVVSKICKKHWIGEVDEHSVPMVNTTAHWSEIGEELLKLNPQYPFAASFTIFEDHIMWSLRSRQDDEGGGFDVSAVAKKFGGGGHRNAAGFSSVRP